MVFHTRRKHNMKKHYLAISVLMVLLIGLAGCSNPSGGDNPPGPQSIVYTSTAGGKTYELTITAATGTAKNGDAYVLKITDGNGTRESTGTITDVSDDGLTLQLSNSGADAVTITINSSGEMTKIEGPIAINGSDEPEPEPGTVTPVDPVIAVEIQVYNEDGSPYTGTATFTTLVRDNHVLLSDFGLGNLVVTNGKLDLSALGTPNANLDSIADWEAEGCTVTAAPGTEFWTHFANGGFSTGINIHWPRLDWDYAGLCYATNDATITGSPSWLEGGSFNITLKKGWNTIIANETTGTIVSGTPDYAVQRWTIGTGD
jgi:hypothetical protein